VRGQVDRPLTFSNPPPSASHFAKLVSRRHTLTRECTFRAIWRISLRALRRSLPGGIMLMASTR
jgi:hypothetical protein